MRALRWVKLLHLASWSLLIAKLLTFAQPQVPQAISFAYDDKLVHALLFGGLVFFLIEAIEAWFSLRYWQLVGLALSFSISYAFLLEALQTFIPGRTVSAFDTVAGIFGSLVAIALIYWLDFSEYRRPKLLLQVCCIGCGAYVSTLLKKDYRVTLYFYNPNIYPEAEYHKRLAETRKFARQLGLKLLVGKYHHAEWLESVKGHEMEPEKGARCIICYRDRLEAAARLASQLKYRYFASTLTISPHKMAAAISQIGNELSVRYRVKFLDRDFKKQDGFKKSVELSRDLGLYRQDYCGCEFSLRDRKA
ncbi:VanZ family protein [Candidatus Falkowbacteria bacterium]|nr:VanZ family protein [Candidatus Falkowbacteria bacterium]